MSWAQLHVEDRLDYMENRRMELGIKRSRTRKISLLKKEESSLRESSLREEVFRKI